MRRNACFAVQTTESPGWPMLSKHALGGTSFIPELDAGERALVITLLRMFS
jgi:hypothetical protein